MICGMFDVESTNNTMVLFKFDKETILKGYWQFFDSTLSTWFTSTGSVKIPAWYSHMVFVSNPIKTV